MKEKPILFSVPMVRAILDGRKTQTRRVAKGPIWDNKDCINTAAPHHYGKYSTPKPCPYGQPGDRLWVRETTCIAPKNFATPDDTCLRDYNGDLRYVSYKADCHCEDAMRDYNLKWTPSIHVPRWASRITLEITGVGLQRLHEISEEDARAEGVEPSDSPIIGFNGKNHTKYGPNKSSFYRLWQSINGPDSWDENPWVWVIDFKRV